VERVIGAIERRVPDVYGRTLWFFLRQRWISALIWVACMWVPSNLFTGGAQAFPVWRPAPSRARIRGAEGSSPTRCMPIRIK